MTEKGYFAASWGDLVKTPGWLGKMLRLGLVLLIPVFGSIVVVGYLYGWAREIAWGVHRPLPKRIFGNEDGQLYKRGFFVFLVGLVFSLAPIVFSFFGGGVLGFVPLLGYGYDGTVFGILVFSMLFNFFVLALSFVAVFFAWVGSMRCSLYGTLSSGFQIGKIWAMMRYDFGGLLRIFGMYLICSTVTICVLGLLFLIALFVGVMSVYALSLGGADWLAVLLAIVAFFFFVYALFVASAVTETLVARALGYWTRQFEVNRWGGQEDLMPFEQRAMAAEAQWRAAQAQAASSQAQGREAPSPRMGQPYMQSGLDERPVPSAQGPSSDSSPTDHVLDSVHDSAPSSSAASQDSGIEARPSSVAERVCADGTLAADVSMQGGASDGAGVAPVASGEEVPYAHAGEPYPYQRTIDQRESSVTMASDHDRDRKDEAK